MNVLLLPAGDDEVRVKAASCAGTEKVPWTWNVSFLVEPREMVVAFALCPTAMDDLIAVSDAGGIMPPKSTWFEPKLADGMVSHVLD